MEDEKERQTGANKQRLRRPWPPSRQIRRKKEKKAVGVGVTP